MCAVLDSHPHAKLELGGGSQVKAHGSAMANTFPYPDAPETEIKKNCTDKTFFSFMLLASMLYPALS